MSPEPSEATLPAAWAEVLDRIQQSLDQTLAAVPDGPDGEPLSPSWRTSWQETSDRLVQRQQRLDARAAQSRRDAEQLEALLAFEAEALQAWLTSASAVKRHIMRRDEG